MASTAPPDDPIRSEVERRLTVAADAFVVRPLEEVAKLGARLGAPCRGVVTRLTRPLGVVRSVAELALRRATGGDVTATAPAGVDAPADMTSPLDEQAGRSRRVARDRAAASDDLPIVEYESLAASQVVARLDGLSDGELERVRMFEVAHRGRRTVLGKLDQLRSGR